MKLGVDGVLVGHWTDSLHETGCTVVLFPEGTIGSGEVRGGAPATREFALLDPTKMMPRLDAVVLTGGSAFGLASADGVVDFCAEHDRGFVTAAAKVPIVVALALYDLASGDSLLFPSPISSPIDDGSAADAIAAGTFAWPAPVDPLSPIENTTIGVIVTNARIDKVSCQLVAQSGHDGLARALFPAHTRGDGDALVVAATQGIDATVDMVRILAVVAVERAVRSVAQTR